MRRATKYLILAACLTRTLALPAQEFDVASVRQHAGEMRNVAGFQMSGSGVMLNCFNIALLVSEAYGLTAMWQVSFSAFPGSDDLMGIYYDISARAPEDRRYTRAEFRKMLQALLSDRFALKSHRERKPTPIYELTQGKNTSKFKKAPDEAGCSVHGSVVPDGQDYQLQGCPIEKLVAVLNQGLADRPVVNKTTLSGNYDFHFIAAFANKDSSLFSAMQELGLKLQARVEPQEILVVDHFEKPTAN